MLRTRVGLTTAWKIHQRSMKQQTRAHHDAAGQAVITARAAVGDSDANSSRQFIHERHTTNDAFETSIHGPDHSKFWCQKKDRTDN